jgi:hypothetical protein
MYEFRVRVRVRVGVRVRVEDRYFVLISNPFHKLNNI